MSKIKMVPAISPDGSEIIVEWEDNHQQVEGSPSFHNKPEAQEWIDGPGQEIRHPSEKKVKKKGTSFDM